MVAMSKDVLASS